MSEERELMVKILEVKEEMKSNGLWKISRPAWVTDFEKKDFSSHHDFIEWLQFVYLPNLVQKNDAMEGIISKNYVAIQARKFFSEDVKKGKLLQLLIELDSLQ